MDIEQPFFVCVHVGAGSHRVELETLYKKLMVSAVKAAGSVLSLSGNVLEAVTVAIKRLEDSPLTNAGKGSNLNYDGEVECDAGIMRGDGLYGSIGAAPGIKNPIGVATALATQSRDPMPLSLVRPIFLAGNGALRWALTNGHKAARSKSEAKKMLVTEEALQKWQVYRSMLKNANATKSKLINQSETTTISDTYRNSVDSASLNEQPRLFEVNDTVGCIVINHKGEVCAGVSSGGIALKSPGRVGESAIYGAGCWAENSSWRHNGGCPAVACSVSGVGENISRSLIARSCAAALAGNFLLDGTVQEYIENESLKWQEPRDVGVITLRGFASTVITDGSQEMQVEFSVLHNTESIGFAYLTGTQKPVAKFLRHKGNSGTVNEYGGYLKWNIP